MFTIAIVAAGLVASSVSAAPIAQRSAPKGWATDYLEEYSTYHTRYTALSCQNKHNTTFFDDCCHPLLATQSLSSLESYCTPNATESASASNYTETASASATESAEAGAESEYCEATSSVESVYSSVVATATASVSADQWTTALTKSSSSAAATATAVADFANGQSSSSHTQHKTSTSSADAAPTSASSSDVKTGGFATYFYQNGNAGECGTVHSDSDKVIAIDSNGWWPDFQSNDNSPNCGKWITLTNTNNGKSVTAMVADVCPTCDTNNSLDLSLGAFQAIADLSDGEVPITWVWA